MSIADIVLLIISGLVIIVGSSYLIYQIIMWLVAGLLFIIKINE